MLLTYDRTTPGSEIFGRSEFQEESPMVDVSVDLVRACVMLVCLDLLFFFFQAEDGIRDLTVTGVQTCALPISRPRPPPGTGPRAGARRGCGGRWRPPQWHPRPAPRSAHRPRASRRWSRWASRQIGRASCRERV